MTPGLPSPSLPGFFRALRNHWLAAMSGAVSVPFSALAAFASSGWERPIWYAMAVFSFGYAAFKIWENERAERLAENAKLIAEVESLARRLAPQFSITCTPEIGRCRIDHTYNGKRAIYLRAVATNRSEAPLHECTAYLTSIQKDGVNLMAHESRRLPFAPGHEADAHSKVLPPNTPIALDVLVMTVQTTVLVATQEPYIFERRQDKTPVFAEAGIYILSIVVSAESGGAREEKLAFEWTRDWETSTLRLC